MFCKVGKVGGVYNRMIEALELVTEICGEARTAFVGEPHSDQIRDFLQLPESLFSIANVEITKLPVLPTLLVPGMSNMRVNVLGNSIKAGEPSFDLLQYRG